MAATKKSIDERIAELQEKQAQLKAKEKQLRAKQSAENRKKEAHRKIVIGGAVESVLGRPIEGDEDINRLITFLKKQEERGRYFSRAMNE